MHNLSEFCKIIWLILIFVSTLPDIWRFLANFARLNTLFIFLMIKEFQYRVLPQNAVNEQAVKDFIAHEEGLDIRTLTAVRVLKRSIEARQRTVMVNLKVRAYINEQPQDDEFVRTEYRNVEGKPKVLVVGAGPG